MALKPDLPKLVTHFVVYNKGSSIWSPYWGSPILGGYGSVP